MPTEMTVNSIVQFGGFLATARVGERAVYHTGFLLDDRVPDKKSGRDAVHARALDMLADHVALSADAGLITLTQRRCGEGQWDYLAIRIKRKGRNF